MIGLVATVSIILQASSGALPPPPQPIPSAANASRDAAAAAAVSPVKVVAKVDPDKIVCHAEAVNGSRLARRVCLSAREAAMRRFEDQQSLDRAQRLWGSY